MSETIELVEIGRAQADYGRQPAQLGVIPFETGAPIDDVTFDEDAIEGDEPNETTEKTAKIPTSAIFLSM